MIEIDADEVTRLRIHHYYDCMLTGEGLWQGKRYWLMLEDQDPWVYINNGGIERYYLIDLPDEEWDFIDRKTAAFRKYVGNHWELDAEGRRNVSDQKPMSEHKKYYGDPQWQNHEYLYKQIEPTAYYINYINISDLEDDDE